MAAAVALLLAPGLAAAQDARPLRDVVVTVDREKLSGQAWDGIGGSGRAGLFILPIPQPMAPPDLALCIVPPAGAVVCYGDRTMADPRSIDLRPRCQDRITCAFRGVGVPSGAFGIVLLDLDRVAHDLVDMAIVTEEPDAGAIDAIARRVRSVARRYTPAMLESTRRARDNELDVVSIRDCSDARAPCRLVQSTVVFTAPRRTSLNERSAAP